MKPKTRIILETHDNFTETVSGIHRKKLLKTDAKKFRILHYFSASGAGVTLPQPHPRKNRYCENTVTAGILKNCRRNSQEKCSKNWGKKNV